ncbi:MAG TPA: GNAT family N-acetyltransferase [Polyangiaceae bacterium]|jgi:GNAT superfamily N-acetyltransferase
MARPSPVVVRELTPDLWPALESLFGAKGACGGCWCMFWRIEKGSKYEDVKGPTAKRRFKALVAKGEAHGLLAFAGDEAVGWCAYERRTDLPRLDRSPSLKIDDAERVWSLPCFFVKAGWRGKGVARVLLREASKALAARGAAILEGYPTKPSGAGKMPAAFAYTGVPSLFESAGFVKADDKNKGKMRYRKHLPVVKNA